MKSSELVSPPPPETNCVPERMDPTEPDSTLSERLVLLPDTPAARPPAGRPIPEAVRYAPSVTGAMPATLSTYVAPFVTPPRTASETVATR